MLETQGELRKLNENYTLRSEYEMSGLLHQMGGSGSELSGSAEWIVDES